MDFGVALRNAWLDAFETHIGTFPRLQFRTGSPPANCAAAGTGTLLASLALPSDWLANASGGTKALAGTWSGAASAGGTLGHFRLMDTDETICHMQGTITLTGGGGDMTVDSLSVASGQTIQVDVATLLSAVV